MPGTMSLVAAFFLDRRGADGTLDTRLEDDRQAGLLQCDERVHLGIPQKKRYGHWVKAAAEEAAIADRRSLSSLVEKLLTDYCRVHGFLKLERKAKRS
jgi:hypothetical protein